MWWHFSGSTHCLQSDLGCAAVLSITSLITRPSLGPGTGEMGHALPAGGRPCHAPPPSVAAGMGSGQWDPRLPSVSIQGRSWLRTVSHGAPSPRWPTSIHATSVGTHRTRSSLPDTRLFSAFGPSAELTGLFYSRHQAFYQSRPRAAAGFHPWPSLQYTQVLRVRVPEQQHLELVRKAHPWALS